MDWHVGQRFTVSSMNYAGHDLEFKIVGVLPGERWSRNFFFRDDYFREATGDKDRFHMMWVRVRDPETGKRVAGEIERMFDKSDTEVLVETESKGVARLTERTHSIVGIVNVVVTILLVDMLVILSNSISISTRERRREMAIFKVLGFQPLYVMAMVIAEAMIVGAIGGALGGLLAYVLSSIRLPVELPALLQLSVTAEAIPLDMLLGLVVGFLGSVIPAWNSRNIKVTEVFAKIA
jgi:putative ABC transport system permease protein